MLKRSVLIGLAGCLWLAAPGGRVFGAGDAGSDPALYLGAGAKAVALGRTGATESATVFALSWNPAGLASVPRCQVAVQHAALFAGAIHDSLAFAYPLLDWGTIAIGAERIQLDDIEGRDANNLPTSAFSYTEQQVLVGYGVPVWGPFAAGAVLKLHDLRLAGLEGTSPGLDLGVLADLLTPAAKSNSVPAMVQALAVGASIRNAVGPLLKLRDDPDRLQPTYRLGTALSLHLLQDIPDLATLRVDAEKPERADWRFHAGLEYAFLDHFAVRGGWDQEYFSAGAGLSWSGATLDYAVSFPALGLRHLLTASFAFGDDLRDVEARRLAEEERQRRAVVDKLKNDIIAGYAQQAREAAAKGDFKEAVRLWGKVLDWEPDDKETQANLKLVADALLRQEIDAALDLARRNFQDERYVDAMVECRRVLELDPHNAAAAELNAKAEKKATTLGEMAFAKEAKAQVRIHEHYLQGLRSYTQRDWETAISHWNQVILDSPLQKQVYQYLEKARANLDKNRPEKAKAAQVAPEEQKRQQLYKEAVDLSRSGKLQDATLKWEKIIQENPKDEDAKNNLDKTRRDLINSQKRGIRW